VIAPVMAWAGSALLLFAYPEITAIDVLICHDLSLLWNRPELTCSNVEENPAVFSKFHIVSVDSEVRFY
jgi:hypothetical protein